MSDWRVMRRAFLAPLLESLAKTDRQIVALVDLDLLTRCGHAGLFKAVPQEIANDCGVYHTSRVDRALRALAAYTTPSSPDPAGRVLAWCPTTFVAYIPGWLELDKPHNPKQALARLRHASHVPDSDPKLEMLVDLRAYIKRKAWRIDERRLVLVADADDDQEAHGADHQDERVDGDGEPAAVQGRPAAASSPEPGPVPAPRTIARAEPLRDSHGAVMDRWVTPVRPPATTASEPAPVPAGDPPCWWPIVEAYRRELHLFPQPSDAEIRCFAADLESAWVRSSKGHVWRTYFAQVALQAAGTQLRVADRLVNVKLRALLQPDVVRAVYAERDRRRAALRQVKADAAGARAEALATGPPEVAPA